MYTTKVLSSGYWLGVCVKRTSNSNRWRTFCDLKLFCWETMSSWLSWLKFWCRFRAGFEFSCTMGVMSRRVVPACGNLCFFCPSMRARSRQPVKRYKKLLAEIFPRNQASYVGIVFVYLLLIWYDVAHSILLDYLSFFDVTAFGRMLNLMTGKLGSYVIMLQKIH